MEKEMLYETAWDAVKNRWVRASQFNNENRAEWYDKPRYYLHDDVDNEDNVILGFVQQSVPFRRKNMKDDTPDVVNRAHFVKLATNTKSNRDEMLKSAATQESNVHKIAKEVGAKLKFIRLPEIRCDILGLDVMLMQSMYVPVKYMSTEEVDVTTGRIPDIRFECEILGVKQELFVEILYTHKVDEIKRRELEKKGISCIEIDISSIKGDLNAGYRQIAEKIKSMICTEGYWVTCGPKIKIMRELMDSEVKEISTRNGLLHRTRYYSEQDRKFFSYKDELGLPEQHKCYLSTERSWEVTGDVKCIDLGKCSKCERCLKIDGYNTEHPAVYCCVNDELLEVHKLMLIDEIRDNLMTKYKEAIKSDRDTY